MFKKSKISVLIPAYNEANSISKVIKELPKDITDEIVVIDNGSTDATKAVAAQSGARVVEEKKRGYGSCCLKGLASIAKTDIVVILDADHSDYPGQITRLLKPIADGEADFVIGSRIMGKSQPGSIAPQAYWGNKLSVFLIRLFFRHRFTDMGPFRAIRFKAIKRLNMTDKNYGWNAEMQIKGIKKGLKIKEVPVDYRKRIGVSKISGTLRGTLMAGTKIILTIFKYRFVKG